MAKTCPEMEKVTEQLYEYNADQAMRDRCEARADYIMYEKRTKRKLEEQEIKLAEQETQLAEQRRQLEELRKIIKEHNIPLE